jgi:hypothetical protein
VSLTAEGVNAMRDTDKSLQAFFDQCAASSPQECAFYSPTASEIKARLDRLYSSIKHQPIPIQTSFGYGYDYVDFSTLRNAVLNSLYSPYLSYAPLAVALKELEQGNGTALLSLVSNATKVDCHCDQPPKRAILGIEGPTAIWCGDGQMIPEQTPVALYHKYLMAAQEYSSFEYVWGDSFSSCV